MPLEALGRALPDLTLRCQETALSLSSGTAGDGVGRRGPAEGGPQPSDGVHKLVDEALGDVWFPDDALLVILADGAAQLVVVHGRPVLAEAPQPGHLSRVLNFEDAWEGRGGGAQRAPAVGGGGVAGERKTKASRSVSVVGGEARARMGGRSIRRGRGGGGGAYCPLPRLRRGLKNCAECVPGPGK